jgi:hypothetical protein
MYLAPKIVRVEFYARMYQDGSDSSLNVLRAKILEQNRNIDSPHHPYCTTLTRRPQNLPAASVRAIIRDLLRELLEVLLSMRHLYLTWVVFLCLGGFGALRQPMTVVEAMAAMLLGDLPTPSLVIEVQTLQRHMDSEAIPTITLCDDVETVLLKPSPIITGVEVSDDAPIEAKQAFASNDVLYLHTQVTRPKEDVSTDDEPRTTFLAEIDLQPRLCGSAQLVLGLTFDYVGSYYWARSAGAGAAMEAPGVLFDARDPSRGVLRWEQEDGPAACNSNDGKRSEWVNFLRRGDHVQLLPAHPEKTILAFLHAYSSDSERRCRMFGVTSKGRPLGSEPVVVCEWKQESINDKL